MKTKYTMLCLLAALSASAGAQEGAPGVPSLPSAPLPPPAPGAPMVGTVEFREGGVVGRVGLQDVMEFGEVGAEGSQFHLAEIPALEEGQVAEPIRWSYQTAQGMWDEPVRAGPVAFLGVSASPPPRELAAHLSIPRDTGLVVEGVIPDSPAAKAGLQQNDVLTKLGDQILIHPRQLSVLVANGKEGDSVNVSFIRKGEPKEVNVILAMRENKGPGKTAHDIILKNKDVVIAGNSHEPLRTFVRKFALPPGAALKQAEAELSIAKAKADAAMARAGAHHAEARKTIVGKGQAEREEADAAQRAEMDEIRQKLDEVLKRLAEQDRK
jgi:membrane-associated protease RseP (regulator of RpoE activity)